MGNYNTTMSSDRSRSLSAIPNYWKPRGYYSNQPKVTKSTNSPVLQRLDSVGEEAPGLEVNGTQFQHLSYDSVKCSMSKMMLELRDNAYKASCGLRPDTFHLSTLSRSMPMSVASNACGVPVGRGHNSGSKGKLLKSHSLPETKSSLGVPFFLADMNSQLNHKPDRSWSIGSYGDERALYQEKPFENNNLNLSFRPSVLNDLSGCVTLKPATCNIQILSNTQGCETKNKCLDLSSERSKPEASDEEFSPESFCISATEKSCHCKEICVPFSTIKIESSKCDFTNLHSTHNPDVELSTISPTSSVCPSSQCSSLHVLEHNHDDSYCTPDLSFVLLSPRKAKKGRPSAKKQKKRKRQKQKHDSLKASLDSSSETLHEPVESHQSVHPNDSVHSCEYEPNSSVINSSNDTTTSLSQNVSTPIKSPPQQHNVHWFLATTSSECEDSELEEDEDSDSSLEVEESVNACISPINSHAFGISLNLDSIFKQKIVPSLESLLSSDCSDDSITASLSKENDFDLSGTGSVTFSDLEDADDSIEFAASSPPSFTKESFFPTLQSKSLGQASGPFKKEDVTAEDFDAEYAVDLHEINTKWDEVYSSPGICICCNKNYAVDASGPFVKVSFPEEPALSTVYTLADIEGEDRAGMWHHYALDRERFERRIKEASQVLSPVLEETHRAAIVKRNADLLKLHSEETINNDCSQDGQVVAMDYDVVAKQLGYEYDVVEWRCGGKEGLVSGPSEGAWSIVLICRFTSQVNRTKHGVGLGGVCVMSQYWTGSLKTASSQVKSDCVAEVVF
ncbi:protein DP71L [Elysia marginata]|uniref:Protein DP71L n=1 Tax=Elysia marginata TaxID=1093978 RepID=A0AAV4G375_9GAST|nr:protein DP71L [Elysia marginata]